MDNVVKLQPATFEAFWKAYPKKVGKPLAIARWEKVTNGPVTTKVLDRPSGTYVTIKLSVTPEELVVAAKKYADTFLDRETYKSDLTYCLHPSTWLNSGRWLDE